MIKLFKSPKKRLFSMIAMSFTVACTSTVYAEITERPKEDATYDEKVVLNSEWQIYPDEYVGANKRKYTFNKGLTISPTVSYTGNAIYLSKNTDVDFELGANSEINLEAQGGALTVDPGSKLTIKGDKSNNLYFRDRTWDTYNEDVTIDMEENSKLDVQAGNLTTSGGAETNLKLFDNAQATIHLNGNFTSNAGGTAIAMENDYHNSDTSLTIQAANITLGTTDLESAHRRSGLYLLAYKEKGDNTLSVALQAKDKLCISGFSKGIQTFGNASIDLKGKTINISACDDVKGQGLSLNSYNATKPSILKAEAENLNISGSNCAIYAEDRVDAQLNAKDINISGSNYAIYAEDRVDAQLNAKDINISGKWGIVSYDSTVNAQAEKAIKIKGNVWTSGGHITVGKDSDDLKTVIEGNLTAKDHGYIAAHVNNAGSRFTGNTSDADWKNVTNESNDGIHLTLNHGSIWENFGGGETQLYNMLIHAEPRLICMMANMGGCSLEH